MDSGTGRKDDTGKLRFDLIPVEPLKKVAEVYTIGAKKYADRNWEKGIQWGRIFAALQRHAWNWWNGETQDPIDGQHHLASVAWCALALIEYERTHRELDDRPNAKQNIPAWVQEGFGGYRPGERTAVGPELVRGTVPRTEDSQRGDVRQECLDGRPQDPPIRNTASNFLWDKDFSDKG